MIDEPIFKASITELKYFKITFEGKGINPLKDKQKSAIN